MLFSLKLVSLHDGFPPGNHVMFAAASFPAQAGSGRLQQCPDRLRSYRTFRHRQADLCRRPALRRMA